MDAVRFLDDSDDGLEGIAIPFDGPFDGKDLHKTRFSASTDYAFDWFPVRPLLYNHGLDEDAGLSVVGQVRTWDIRTDMGVWVQMQLDKGSQFFDGIRDLVRAKKLFLSSGAMGHLVDEDAATGEVRRWPWVELSLTPTPSNYYATVDFTTARAHFRSAGLDLPLDMEGSDIRARDGNEDDPAVRAVWSTATVNDLPDSSFAFISPGGSKDSDGKTTPRSLRHLPYKDKQGKPDAAHVRAALARLDQTDIPAAAKAAARKKLLAAARTLGIDVSASTESGRTARLPIGGPGQTLVPATRQVDDGADADEDEPSGYDGSYEDLISDLRDLLNPSNPFSQAGYSSIIATYPDHVLCCRWDGYADGDSDEQTYWRVAYAVGADGEPTLGAATQVEQTYVPVASSRSSPGPLALDAHHLTLHAGAFAQRTQGLSDRRIREGRVLSAPNRRLVADAYAHLGEAHQALGDFLAATDRQADEAARAAQWGDPAYRRQQFALLDLFASTVD